MNTNEKLIDLLYQTQARLNEAEHEVTRLRGQLHDANVELDRFRKLTDADKIAVEAVERYRESPINGIKYIRQHLDLGLKDAKDLFEKHRGR